MLVPAWTLAISLWQHAHPAFVDSPVAFCMGLTEEDDLRRLAA
jgi:NhaC family Na+:H+ antiporter